MSTANPYAAPRARVADVQRDLTDYQPVKFFSSQGRVGRIRYLAHTMAGYLVFAIAAFGLGFMFGAMGMPKLATAAAVIAIVPYLIFVLMKTIQRSHDMDWSGWTALLAFIPLVGLIWVFKGGTSDSNSYGEPPPPNRRSVAIVAVAVVGVALIGILAAIAIPAYQQYTVRAKAAQAAKAAPAIQAPKAIEAGK
jgi:uncharacterized membrane protein YhaH (DUF805 family)